MINDVEKYVKNLIEHDELWKFYKSTEWIMLKKQVLAEAHYECAECKRHGIVTRYDIDEEGTKRLLSTVHHVQFVRKHPALALSKTYEYKGKTYTNLIPVCKACHNRLHPEKHNSKHQNDDKYCNEERW